MNPSPLFRSIAIALAILGILSARHTRAAESESAPWVNVKDFGAMGDCRRVTDGTIHKDSDVFISATARFTKEDIGQPIYILGASAQKFDGLGEVLGAPLSSRIVSVIDASTVKLADKARQDASPAQACLGTDDSQAIQKAIDSLVDTGGTVYFPQGLYRVTYQGGPGIKVTVSNVRLHGTGTASAIFNSTVLFRAKIKDGRLLTEQSGVPALYVGSPARKIENVEVDHLWLGDNGQDYNYRDWGPHGWGVLGCAGKIDRVHLHDLTVETSFLCGVNMDSETNGFSIHHVNILSSGEHGLYLAGTGADGEVHDNRILGTTRPMRQGMAIKKKNRLRITHNEIANVDFQGICVVGDIADHQSHDIVIEDNWLHDLKTWHTEGIVVSNATDVIIRSNRIEDTSWVGISLRTVERNVSKVLIKDNIITRAGQMNPCFAIAVRYEPLRSNLNETTWPGQISDVVVEGNVITDCPNGIWFSNVSGESAIRGNRVHRSHSSAEGMSYRVDALPGHRTILSGNTSTNYGRSMISSDVESRDNALQ